MSQGEAGGEEGEKTPIGAGEDGGKNQAERKGGQSALARNTAMTLLPENFRSATIPRQPNGSLGMVVREREDGNCYVEGFADNAAEVTARGSVMPGDHILAVAGKFIDGKGQKYLRELLQDAPDPVVLLLRRDTSSESVRNGGTPRGAARGEAGRDDGSEAASADSYGSAPDQNEVSQVVQQPVLPPAPIISLPPAPAISEPPPPPVVSIPPVAPTVMPLVPPAPVMPLPPVPVTLVDLPSPNLASGARLATENTGTAKTPSDSLKGINQMQTDKVGDQIVAANDNRLRPQALDQTVLQSIRRAAEATAPPPGTVGSSPFADKPAKKKRKTASQHNYKYPQQMYSAAMPSTVYGGGGIIPGSSTNTEKDVMNTAVRFGLGPVSVVLERARSDVDALIGAYKANVFTRWQLKTALRERAPALDGRPSKVLRQGTSHHVVSDASAAMINADAAIETNKKNSAQLISSQKGSFSILGTPDERQRMLMLMLAHNIPPEYIDAHVLNRDKDTHLRRDKLVSSRGYYIAISQDRMRRLYEDNDSRPVYLYFTGNELAPLPRLFTDCGFTRSRATMSIDKVPEKVNTFRAQLQRVRFSFISANHPDEAPLIVDYNLFHTRPYYDLLGINPGVGLIALKNALKEASARASSAQRPNAHQQLAPVSLHGNTKRNNTTSPKPGASAKRPLAPDSESSLNHHDQQPTRTDSMSISSPQAQEAKVSKPPSSTDERMIDIKEVAIPSQNAPPSQAPPQTIDNSQIPSQQNTSPPPPLTFPITEEK